MNIIINCWTECLIEWWRELQIEILFRCCFLNTGIRYKEADIIMWLHYLLLLWNIFHKAIPLAQWSLHLTAFNYILMKNIFVLIEISCYLMTDGVTDYRNSPSLGITHFFSFYCRTLLIHWLWQMLLHQTCMMPLSEPWPGPIYNI